MCKPLFFYLKNNDCISGRCEQGVHTFQRICKTKAGEGSQCNENSDCFDPHSCTWGFVCGQACLKTAECPSKKYCSLLFTCNEKKEDGKGCFFNDECEGGKCSLHGKCGRGCALDRHCDTTTERCDSFTLTCQPKKEIGETCGEDDDCKSGGCSWALHCGKPCIFDNDCTSKRCSKKLICEPKLANGNSCGEGKHTCFDSYTSSKEARKLQLT